MGVFIDLFASTPENHGKNKIIYGLPLIVVFVVTREVIRQYSLVTHFMNILAA